MTMKVASSNGSNETISKIDMRQSMKKAKSLSFIKEENGETDTETLSGGDTTDKIERECGSVNNIDVEERPGLVSQTVSFLNPLRFWQRKPKEEELAESVASLEDVATQITTHDSLWNLFRQELDDSNVVTNGGALAVLDKFTREKMDNSETDDGKSVSYSKMQEASSRRESKNKNLAGFRSEAETEEKEESSWFTRLNASLQEEMDYSNRSRSSKSVVSCPPTQHDYSANLSRFDDNGDSELFSSLSVVSSTAYERQKNGPVNSNFRRRFTMLTSSRHEDYDNARKKRNGIVSMNDDIYVPEESRFGFMDRLREEVVEEKHQELPRGNIPGTTQSKQHKKRAQRRRSSLASSVCSDDSGDGSSVMTFNTMNADALRQALQKPDVHSLRESLQKSSSMKITRRNTMR